MRMTPKEAMDALDERYERVRAALAKLPKGADVINWMLSLSDTSVDYIQLFRDAELPAGPVVATRRLESGRTENIVQVAGIDVIWIGPKEAEP